MRPVNVHIVCADGRHKDGAVYPFGDSIPVATMHKGRRVEREVLTRAGDPERKMRPVEEFRCPLCHRNPRYTAADWHRICETWRDDGRDTLDISTLDR